MFVENQKIERIPLEKLILWSENPRDDISTNSSNEDIIKLALDDKSEHWKLKKLAKEMGDYYDYSELPIVVFKNEKPVVYDGNCRIILAMLKMNIFPNIHVNFQLPEIPSEIPCNVCPEEIALQSILRKHTNNGSWKELERDKFLFKFMNRIKTVFLIIDDATSIISNNSEMNQRFVKDEVFSNDNLKKMGFLIENNQFKSQHNKENTKKILDAIVDSVISKKITTRTSRGDIISTFEDNIKHIINNDKNNNYSVIKLGANKINNNQPEMHLRSRTKEEKKQLFGRKIILQKGLVNDLYRDILVLYDFFQDALKRKQISTSFIGLIRMSLRLLVETAAVSCKYSKVDQYIEEYFVKAKNKLSDDMKTYLYSNNVKDNTIISLLHIGAHNYISSLSIEQAIAISIIIGEMLEISHGVNSR